MSNTPKSKTSKGPCAKIRAILVSDRVRSAKPKHSEKDLDLEDESG